MEGKPALLENRLCVETEGYRDVEEKTDNQHIKYIMKNETEAKLDTDEKPKYLIIVVHKRSGLYVRYVKCHSYI